MSVQIDENLIYEGEKTTMMTFPDIPSNHPRIIHGCDLKPTKTSFLSVDPNDHQQKNSKASIYELSVPDDFIFSSTACHRGYIGTWEVKDGRLYLVNIEGYYRLKGEEPLFAEWYSGVLLIPRGRSLGSCSFFILYEKVLHVHVDKGRVLGSKLVKKTDK